MGCRFLYLNMSIFQRSLSARQCRALCAAELRWLAFGYRPLVIGYWTLLWSYRLIASLPHRLIAAELRILYCRQKGRG